MNESALHDKAEPAIDPVELGQALRGIAERIGGLNLDAPEDLIAAELGDCTHELHRIAEILDPGGMEGLLAYVIPEVGDDRDTPEAGSQP